MPDNEMIVKNTENALTPDSMAAIAAAVQEIMKPVMAGLIEIMGKNTEAVQYLAAQQKIQSDRMEALEKQIRLNTLVTQAQTRHINNAVRDRARKLLEKYNLENDQKCVKALCGHIRKAVLMRYGISSLHDLPQCEYSVVMQQVDIWNDLLIIRDVKRSAEAPAQTARHYPYDDKTESGLLEE